MLIVGLIAVSVLAFFSGVFTGAWLAQRPSEAPKEETPANG